MKETRKEENIGRGGGAEREGEGIGRGEGEGIGGWGRQGTHLKIKTIC